MLIERAANFLQVSWKAVSEKSRSVFRPAQTSTPQPFPVFPDLLEEVKASWQHPASAPTVSRSAAALTSMEGAEAIGLAKFPPVDSTIAALVQAPPVGGLSKDPVCLNDQCRITEAHLKKAHAAEAQLTCLANTGGLLTAYLDGMLRSITLPEPLASELRAIFGALLQISVFQGQALAGLVVAHRLLWLSQARVPDVGKSALLDAPSPLAILLDQR
ncbi:UNVERIFIED_CONTAM: hypothetical protein FKN15_059276 [Acipenser sinensis]